MTNTIMLIMIFRAKVISANKALAVGRSARTSRRAAEAQASENARANL
jgi:hypothetical protein